MRTQPKAGQTPQPARNPCILTTLETKNAPLQKGILAKRMGNYRCPSPSLPVTVAARSATGKPVARTITLPQPPTSHNRFLSRNRTDDPLNTH